MALEPLIQIPKNRAVQLTVDFYLSQGYILVGIQDVGPYNFKRHKDIDGMVTTICDALQKSKRIFNDSRITSIVAAIMDD